MGLQIHNRTDYMQPNRPTPGGSWGHAFHARLYYTVIKNMKCCHANKPRLANISDMGDYAYGGKKRV